MHVPTNMTKVVKDTDAIGAHQEVNSGGLNTAEIIYIAIGCLAFVAVVLGVLTYWMEKRAERRRRQAKFGAMAADEAAATEAVQIKYKPQAYQPGSSSQSQYSPPPYPSGSTAQSHVSHISATHPIFNKRRTHQPARDKRDSDIEGATKLQSITEFD